MLPFLKFSVAGYPFVFSTNNILILLCIFGSMIGLYLEFKNRISATRIVSILVVVACASLLGGRLFHVFFERPELLHTPALIFSQLDGMTFYGSLFLGGLTFFFISRWLVPNYLLNDFFDQAAIAVALSNAVLRLGCFANGCCWGKMTNVPWAVTYLESNSAMPYLGIPVHPVQIYDAILGMMITLILVFMNKLKASNLRHFRGQLIWVFCWLYAFVRFFTEPYRGDSFRGENIFFNLSTSQLISVVICSVLFFKIYKILRFTFISKRSIAKS